MASPKARKKKSRRATTPLEKRIVIVGGGFGGVRAALTLSRQKPVATRIILISRDFHFEYYPVLYKVAVGHSPFEVCIPLPEIFAGTNVEIIEDTISEVDLQQRKLTGKSGSHYGYDYLVLALGSETAYFNIPGLRESALAFKSIHDALRIKNHIHEIFFKCDRADPAEKTCVHNIVVVGGGATGVELAGDLAVYARKLAQEHGLEPLIVTVNLIEAAPRLMSMLPPDISAVIKKRLHALGVNVFVNRMVVKGDIDGIFMKDMQMDARTVVWTAGVQPNQLYAAIDGLKRDKRGRIEVDKYLQARGFRDVFVIGDGAATPYAGMAQTANYDGEFVAHNISRRLERGTMRVYKPKKPIVVIPLGLGWGVANFRGIRVYGRLAWWLRQFADFRYLWSILPWRKALAAFRNGDTLYESCPTCCAHLANERPKK